MGTETKQYWGTVILVHKDVKLNNPLMGTETLLKPRLYPIFTSLRVKLNNPLMGTETFSFLISRKTLFTTSLN